MNPVKMTYSRAPMRKGVFKITITSLKRGVVYRTARHIWKCEKKGDIVIGLDENDTSQGITGCKSQAEARDLIREAHISAYHTKEVRQFWKYQNANA